MNNIINLPRLTYSFEKIPEISRVNMSGFPNKITLDISILHMDYLDYYIDQIVENIKIHKYNDDINISKEYLLFLLNHPDNTNNTGGLYRVNIPIKRLHKGSYCISRIDIDKKYLMEGELILNSNFAQFPIKINNARHEEKVNKLLSKIRNAVEYCLLDTEQFMNYCPSLKGEMDEKNKFCKYCTNAKLQLIRRAQ